MEKYGSPRTTKFFKGEELEYKLEGDEIWYKGLIEDYNVDQNRIVLADRYIEVDKIEALRKTRNWAKPAGKQLFYFGVAWSGFAFVGTHTDKNDDTHYKWSDVAVTGTSWLAGWLVPKIFHYRTYKMGKRRRLRLLDISAFRKTNEKNNPLGVK